MGSTHPALASAQPERDVCVRRDYLIGTHEVTFADYETYALETGAERLSDQGWGRADRPVINVNFQEARDYARWFGQRVGGDCGLPTEAEWEYAARAGTTSAYALPAPGGGDDIAGRELANCNGCGGQWEGRQTAPVGQFPANARGLYDMHGNVLEWVEDCWHDNYEDAPADGSAWLEDNDGKCRQRVVRGGSWALGPLSLHSAYRHSYSDLTESPELGFRVACR
jgi:formylglycine-generating enzyme required for sulfatase activity